MDDLTLRYYEAEMRYLREADHYEWSYSRG